MRIACVTATPSRRHRRIEVREQRYCARCWGPFTPARADAVFCSPACKQAAYRDRRPHPWAVVVWNGRAMDASFSYHRTRTAAARHAPADGRVFTVVNVARKPWVHMPSINELLFGSAHEPG
jgi:hypothetical protein